MPSFVNFVEAADFHGLRFAFDSKAHFLRRYIWFLIIFCSVIFLSLFTVSRLNYLYTYPSVYNIVASPNSAPVLAVAICPAFDKVVLPPSTEWENLTDNEVVYLLHFGLKTPILQLRDNNTNEYVLSEKWMNYFSSFPAALGNDMFSRICNNPGGSNWLSYQIFDCTAGYISRSLEEVNAVIQRIKRVSRELVFQIDKDLISAQKRLGVKQDGITNMIIRCILHHVPPRSNEDCLSSIHSIYTLSYGSCITFDNINGSKAFYKDQDRDPDIRGSNYLEIQTNPIYQNYAFNFQSFLMLVYDAEEYPDEKYQSLIYYQWLSFDSHTDYKVSGVYSQHVLDKPYGSEKCNARQRHSHCMDQCIKRVSITSEVAILPEGVEEKMTILRDCRSECPRSCDYTWATVETKFTGTGSILLNRIVFLLPARELYLTYSQAELYTPLDFLAELGGFVGLFIGASVLTMYHLLEFIAISFVNKLGKKAC